MAWRTHEVTCHPASRVRPHPRLKAALTAWAKRRGAGAGLMAKARKGK